MRTSLRGWLASVGLGLGVGAAAAQTPTLPKLPDVPLPMATPPAREVVPTPPPTKNLLPPMPADLGTPTPAPYFGCSTCGDVNPACADPGCAGAMPLGPKEPVWMNYTALLLWFQPQRQPFPLATGAAPGQPTRTLLAGTDELGKYLGGKVDGGLWLNKEHTIGAGLDGFITEHRSSFQRVDSPGLGGFTIQRPFRDVTLLGAPPAVVTVANADPASPLGTYAGSMATTLTARLASIGTHLRRNVVYTDTCEADLMFGFRYYDLDEWLTVYQRTALPAALGDNGGSPFDGGMTVRLTDRAYTRNQFYGGEIGTRVAWKHRLGFVSVTPKLAFGATHQVTQISGETRTEGDSPVVVPGGVLAVGANGDGNLGRFTRNRFTVATDVGVAAGVNLTKNTQLVLGYQFYFLANMARPGQQFDDAINPRLVPVSSSFGALTGPRSPNVTNDREGFYAHGVSVGWRAVY